MHMQQTPETMQTAPEYEDVVSEVHAFFQERLQKFESSGIERARISGSRVRIR
jgi:dihydropteroate synthase